MNETQFQNALETHPNRNHAIDRMLDDLDDVVDQRNREDEQGDAMSGDRFE